MALIQVRGEYDNKFHIASLNPEYDELTFEIAKRMLPIAQSLNYNISLTLQSPDSIEMKVSYVCEYCGAENPSDTLKCNRCGADNPRLKLKKI